MEKATRQQAPDLALPPGIRGKRGLAPWKVDSADQICILKVYRETKMAHLSLRLQKMRDLAMDVAEDAESPFHHGAVLFTHHTVYNTSCNSQGSSIYGYDVPAVHAEASCLKPLYSRQRRKGGICILWA